MSTAYVIHCKRGGHYYIVIDDGNTWKLCDSLWPPRDLDTEQLTQHLLSAKESDNTILAFIPTNSDMNLDAMEDTLSQLLDWLQNGFTYHNNQSDNGTELTTTNLMSHDNNNNNQQLPRTSSHASSTCSNGKRTHEDETAMIHGPQPSRLTAASLENSHLDHQFSRHHQPSSQASSTCSSGKRTRLDNPATEESEQPQVNESIQHH